MPLYDYLCGSCGGSFEARRGVDQAAPACPGCGASEVRRKLSLFAAAVGPSGRSSSPSGPASSGGRCACGGACACAG